MFIIDGRMLPYYPVINAVEYLLRHDGLSQKDVDRLMDNQYEMVVLLSQIIGLKCSCYMLRNTTFMCESVPDSLYRLKNELIKELAEKYQYTFDDEWMEHI